MTEYSHFDNTAPCGGKGLAVGAAGSEVTVTDSSGNFYQAGVAVTSTAAELNALDGITATVAELNILDGVTSTATELNILDGVTSTTAELNILDGVTATAVELNALDGITSTVGELNLVDNIWNSFTTTATPASGTCGVQFIFKDVAGTTMAIPVTGVFYLSSVSTGLDHLPATTGVAVLTNGAVTEISAAHKAWTYTTTAAGLVGITITAAADDYYVVFQHPTGKLAISSVCTVNA